MLSQLHECARNYRRLLPSSTRVIAVGGVSEKTTTKESIAAVLSQRFTVLKNVGGTNDLIGLPSALFSLDSDHDFGIFEFHTNHFGEIRTLAGLLQPDIAIITNIGVAPVEFHGAERNVADEIGMLLEALPANGDGLAILNADDRWCNELRQHTYATVVTIGIENCADIRASDVKINGGITFRLDIARKSDSVIIRLRTREHRQIYSALQAGAVGYFAGMDIEDIREGLESDESPTVWN